MNCNDSEIQGVKFVPYIGEEYDKGIEGKRVMILGESCYAWESECEEDTEGSRKRPSRDHAEILVKEDRNPDHGVKFVRLIRETFENALPGKFQDRDSFWKRVMFYEYVQEAMDSQHVRPLRKEWTNAIGPFREVMKRHKPDIIFVFGFQLWSNLPEEDEPESKCEIPEVCGVELWRCSYVLEGPENSRVTAYRIHHPSRGYSVENWAKCIKFAIEVG